MEEYLIRLHMNSDDSLADMQIFFKDNEIISLNSSELDHVEIVWEKYELPFTGNKLILVRKNVAKEVLFNITVNGANGVLKINENKYDIICDWLR